MVFTGAFVYLQWQKESVFGVAAANIATVGEQFGFEQKITNWSFTNNKIPLSQLNDVRVKTYAYGQTRGTLSLDFVLSSPWFFELIGFKDGGTAGCAAPYTHTWSLDTTSATKLIQSYTVQIGQEAGATDIVRTTVGNIANSATITTTIGEVVRVSLDGNYANETLTSTLDSCLAPISVCNHIPFTFAHGTLEFPNCTVIAEVQDVDVTFSQNSDHLWGIGNSVAASAYKKLFEISGKFKASYTCTTQLAKIYAQQNDTLANSCPAQTLAIEQPTMKLTFTNGVAGAGERSITISLTGISLADHNLNIEPNEPIFEELNFQARDATVVAKNAIATIPPAS